MECEVCQRLLEWAAREKKSWAGLMKLMEHLQHSGHTLELPGVREIGESDVARIKARMEEYTQKYLPPLKEEP